MVQIRYLIKNYPSFSGLDWSAELVRHIKILNVNTEKTALLKGGLWERLAEHLLNDFNMAYHYESFGGLDQVIGFKIHATTEELTLFLLGISDINIMKVVTLEDWERRKQNSEVSEIVIM